MAKKIFAEVRRQRLTHTFTDAPYKTVKMELVLKAKDENDGYVEVSRIETKKFLFFTRTKKSYVGSYSIKTLVSDIKNTYWNQDFSYANNVSYWADIIEMAWNKSLKRVQSDLMKQYDYEARIREAKTRELA